RPAGPLRGRSCRVRLQKAVRPEEGRCPNLLGPPGEAQVGGEGQTRLGLVHRPGEGTLQPAVQQGTPSQGGYTRLLAYPRCDRGPRFGGMALVAVSGRPAEGTSCQCPVKPPAWAILLRRWYSASPTDSSSRPGDKVWTLPSS